jgi:RNA polymerase primary sigma factor
MKSTRKEHKKGLEKLIMIGKDKGYLTYAELNDLLPGDLLTQAQIEPIVTILEELDIVVSEVIPDADTLG